MQIICIGDCDLVNECHACADSISDALTKTENDVSINYLRVKNAGDVQDDGIQIDENRIVVVESGTLTVE